MIPPLLQRLVLHRLFNRVLLGLLAGVYVVYAASFGHFLPISAPAPSAAVVVYAEETSPSLALAYWTPTNMSNAIDADQQMGQTAAPAQENTDISQARAAQQDGTRPRDTSISYPVSTVGKVFLTNAAGQNMVCSGTAVVSNNHSVVDTAGHCLYWQKGWMKNVIFCPLYENGNTPYSCWAARDLEVPADWIDASPNDLHHDFGMAIVAANDQGNLTDVVGGAGWAYNQSISRSFLAYGYPAAYPFDGQTRKNCEGTGTGWQHGGGTVVSIPCDMTGGSSGGPWFTQIGNNLYLNGHNDFISSMQRGHMFSPYYDDTWYALYQKAQQT